MKKIFYALILLLSFIIAPLVHSGGISAAHAQGLADMADDSPKADGDTGDTSKKNNFSFNGFVRSNFVLGKDDYYLNDNVQVQKGGVTLQFLLEGYASNLAHFYSATNFELDLTTDFYNLDKDRFEYNNTADKSYLTGIEQYLEKVPFLKIVEAYVDLYPAEWMSIRTGKQIITWGEIEGIEAPTDIVTPWDYTTKSTVFEDARMGIWAMAFNFFFARQKIELVWSPVPQPSRMLKKDILQKSTVGGVTAVPRVERLDFKIKHSEAAIRMSGQIGTFFKYGAAFLYGYDDLPDSEIRYRLDSSPFTSPQPAYEALITSSDSLNVYLVYHRVMVPALDLAFDIKDLFSLKASGVVYITKDFEGKRDEYRNSYAKYLFGAESTNIGADIYFALYVGQHWVINYTKYHDHRAISHNDALNADWDEGRISNQHNLINNEDMMNGFDEKYTYKWLVSGIIQRSFLKHKNLDLGLRYAISASPQFDDIDFIVNFNLMYRFMDGVSATLGLIAADKLDVIKNMMILEFQYSF